MGRGDCCALYFMMENIGYEWYNQNVKDMDESEFAKEDIVSLNVAETFELLFDKKTMLHTKHYRNCKKKALKQIVFILIWID